MNLVQRVNVCYCFQCFMFTHGQSSLDVAQLSGSIRTVADSFTDRSFMIPLCLNDDKMIKIQFAIKLGNGFWFIRAVRTLLLASGNINKCSSWR